MDPAPRVSLGTYSLANVFSPLTESEARTVLQDYLDLGGFYLDTAPLYGFGRVEELIGQVLTGVRRDRFYLATKFGYVWQTGHPPGKAGSAAAPDGFWWSKEMRVYLGLNGRYQQVVAECEASLRRLGVDVIDLYMVHVPDESTPCEETMAAMADLQAQGKIRQIGVSNVSLSQLRAYNQTGLVRYVQNRFSLLNQSMDAEFVAYCREKGIGNTPYQVIERGLLTDRVLGGMKIGQGDIRQLKPEFAPLVRQVVGRWVRDHLKPVADEVGVPVATLAIWWALQQPTVAFCICGATRKTQLVSNLQAASLTPPADTLARIEDGYQMLLAEHGSVVGQKELWSW
jgi:methylglyoxal reductase